MQHLDEGTIHSWLDGALDAEEATGVQAHVAECAQCASAVAEARGFIAASSRILTALDDVPRGVVPVVPRAKTTNWAVWRAAAAVVVVALGSFAVLKGRTGRQELAHDMTIVSARSPMAVRPMGPSNTGVVPVTTDSSAPESVASSDAGSGVSPAASNKRAEKIARPDSREKVADQSATNSAIPPRENAPGLDSRTTTSATITPMAAPSAAVAGGISALSMRVPQLNSTLTEIRRDSGAGAVRITYAAGPSDTVVLEERDNVIRLRGASSAFNKESEVVPASPRALSPVREFNTITWQDSTTHKTLTLSGNVAMRELQEIKRRIDAERAAAKKP